MPSLFRPLLASVLCGVIVFGPVPVWMHVAVCDGHGHSVASVDAEALNQSRLGCPHGCQHHVVADKSADVLHDSPRPGDQHPHDSDTCYVCQSLVGPSGVNWNLLVSPPSVLALHPVPHAAESVSFATLLSIPQPRGPPVAA